jgi:hypothetical protein
LDETGMKWNAILYGLLFSGLGAFSYLLLVNYTELSAHVADVLYSKGAFVFFGVFDIEDQFVDE